MDNCIESIYKVSQNAKKQICFKTSLFCDEKYLESLHLLSEAEPDLLDQTHDKTNYKAVSEKLFCYACDMHFESVHLMRQHQWTYKHRVNKGWIKSKRSSDGEEDNDDSDNESFDEFALDEEVEVSDDAASEEDCDERCNMAVNVDNSYNKIASLDFLSQLKSRKISFHDACTFPTMYFQNLSKSIVGIKRCILFNKKNKPESQSELSSCVQVLSEVKKCAMFMYSGGSFAGAIFEGNKQVLSKTFKRYTYRRKQGGSQTNKDNQGRAPKSAGAFLRRVNTQRLIEDVFELIHHKWRTQIDECGLILIWSAKNQRYIFGHEGLLNHQYKNLSFDISKDPRVRFISARVSKVNNTTILDVYRQISTIEIYDAESIDNFVSEGSQIENGFSKPQPTEIKVKKKVPKKKTKKEKVTEDTNRNTKVVEDEESKTEIVAVVKPEIREDVEIRNKMLNYVLNDSAEDLIPYICELKVSKSCDEISSLLSAPLKTKNQSLLHIAVCHDNNNVIPVLLQLGCDPVHRNSDDETAYALAIRQRNKAACNIMSTYMFENPTQYDYFAAKFPGGRDPLQELDRKKKEIEKKKQYKKNRIQRMKIEEEEKKKEAIEKCKRDQFLSLDDSLKLTFVRKVQYDQRKSFMLCFQCARDISDMVPFSYRDFVFCAMDCLKKHRSAREK